MLNRDVIVDVQVQQPPVLPEDDILQQARRRIGKQAGGNFSARTCRVLFHEEMLRSVGNQLLEQGRGHGFIDMGAAKSARDRRRPRAVLPRKRQTGVQAMVGLAKDAKRPERLSLILGLPLNEIGSYEQIFVARFSMRAGSDLEFIRLHHSNASQHVSRFARSDAFALTIN